MRKKGKLFAVLAFLLLLMSCQGLIEGLFSDADDDDESSSRSSKQLTVTISNYTDVIEGSSSGSARLARTISADSYTTADSLKFYIYGSSTDGQTLSPTEVTFAAASGSSYAGTVQLNISSSNWYLTLAAVSSTDSASTVADVETNAVLAGRANVDLRTGSEATFILSVDGLKKAAAITLTLKSESTWWATGGYSTNTDWSVKAGIYDRVSGEDASIAGDGSGTATEKTVSSASFGESTGVSYSLDAMAPGTYLFKVTLANSSTNKKYYWSDIIRVLPGKALTQDVTIPNIIGTAPTAPTDFYAQYKSTAAGTAELADMSQYLDCFVADFKWTDNSNNEEYFEIDIAEIPEDTDSSSFDESSLASLTDTTWTSTFSSGVTTYDAKKFWTTTEGNVIRYESNSSNPSSLLSGSEHAEFLLSLGKRYFARIRSVNAAGASSYVYLDLSHTADLGYLNFGKTVNLFRISYDLKGGKYYKDGSSSTSGVSSIREYYTRNSTAGVSIINISNGAYSSSGTNNCGNANPTVVNANSDGIYTGWIDEDKKTVDASTTYKGYKNLNLFAVGGSASVTIVNANDYAINAGWVSITDKDSKGVTITDNAATAAAGNTTVSFTLPSGSDTWVYKSLEIEIKRNDGTSVVRKSFDIARDMAVSVSDYLSSGIYQVSLVGTYGNITNSFVITLTVTN